MTFTWPSRGGVIRKVFFCFSGALYVSKNLNLDEISAVSTWTSSTLSDAFTTSLEIWWFKWTWVRDNLWNRNQARQQMNFNILLNTPVTKAGKQNGKVSYTSLLLVLSFDAAGRGDGFCCTVLAAEASSSKKSDLDFLEMPKKTNN